MAGKVTFDRDRCKGCELCALVCPKHIIVMDADATNARAIIPQLCVTRTLKSVPDAPAAPRCVLIPSLP